MSLSLRKVVVSALAAAVSLGLNAEYVFNKMAGRDAMSLDGSGDVSMACWVRISGTQNGGFFNAGASGGSIKGFALYSSGTTCGFRVGNADDAKDCFSASAEFPHDGTWHHVVGVHDKTGGHMYFYVDGELAGSSDVVRSSVTCGAICLNFRSGHGSICNTFYNSVSTRLAEAHVWNRALTAAEAKTLYEGVFPVSSEKELVYWPLHQESGVQVHGFTADGHDNDTTLSNVSEGSTWFDDPDYPRDRVTLRDVVTGSRRFTNGGPDAQAKVRLVAAVPEGMTKFQITAYGAEPEAQGWAPVEGLPEFLEFVRPAADADLAWTVHFAADDLAETVAIPTRSIRYTATVLPVIAYVDSLTAKLEEEGVNRTVEYKSYDNVSTPSYGGGISSAEGVVQQGVPVAQRRLEYKSGPQVDQDDDFNTFTAGTTGDYKLTFAVVNEAGNRTDAEVALRLEAFVQTPYWIFADNQITDGCFTFQAKVLSTDGKTIQCGALIPGESNYPPAGTAPLDFSKPVWNDTDHDWKVTSISYISGTAWGNGGVFMPHAPSGYEWDCVPNAIVFHPDTTTIGDGAFGYWKDGGRTSAYWSGLTGSKIVVPAGVTSIGKAVFACTKAGWIDFQAPGGVSLGMYAMSFAMMTNISGKIRGNIQNSTIRGNVLTCPLDLTGVTTLSHGESVRQTTCPWVKISTNLTNWSAIYLNPTKLSGFPARLTTLVGSISNVRFVQEDGVTDVGTLDLAGMTSLGDSKLSGTTGYDELLIPSTLKTVGASTFWNSSAANVTVEDGGLATSVGARAFTSKNLAKIAFFGAPPETMDANFLAGTSSDGKTKLMDNLQMTVCVHAKHVAEWREYADGGSIPGTITRGTTQKIKTFGSGLLLMVR